MVVLHFSYWSLAFSFLVNTSAEIHKQPACCSCLQQRSRLFLIENEKGHRGRKADLSEPYGINTTDHGRQSCQRKQCKLPAVAASGHFFNAASISFTALGNVTFKRLTFLSKAGTATALFCTMIFAAEQIESCNRAEWLTSKNSFFSSLYVFRAG